MSMQTQGHTVHLRTQACILASTCAHTHKHARTRTRIRRRICTPMHNCRSCNWSLWLWGAGHHNSTLSGLRVSSSMASAYCSCYNRGVERWKVKIHKITVLPACSLASQRWQGCLLGWLYLWSRCDWGSMLPCWLGACTSSVASRALDSPALSFAAAGGGSWPWILVSQMHVVQMRAKRSRIVRACLQRAPLLEGWEQAAVAPQGQPQLPVLPHSYILETISRAPFPQHSHTPATP